MVSIVSLPLAFRDTNMEQLPIPPATATQQAPIIERVQKILAHHKATTGFDSAQPTGNTDVTTPRSLSGVEGDVPQLEAEIDQLVYALYSLTEDEIAVVEGKK